MSARTELEHAYFRLAHSHMDADALARPSCRARLVERLLTATPRDGIVLELGCGNGAPVAAAIAAEGRHVVGVDTVFRRLQQARVAVPSGSFLCATFLELAMRPATVDGVVAFHGLIHAPQARFADLLTRVGSWIRPGGLIVFSVGAATSLWPSEYAPPGVVCIDPSATDQIVRAAGLVLADRQVTEYADGAGHVAFQWVTAVRR